MGDTPSPADLDQLSWKSDGEVQTANDGRCFYMRETLGSRIAGVVFAVAMMAAAGMFVVSALQTDAHGFAVFMAGVGALFAWILVASLRGGRWLIVYDRGGDGAPAEIRHKGKCLPAERVRLLTTIDAGGRMPRRMVVAELHDGTRELLGPTGVLTWADHWAQQAATWMGLPYQRGNG
jgi:hypothetical protein